MRGRQFGKIYSREISKDLHKSQQSNQQTYNDHHNSHQKRYQNQQRLIEITETNRIQNTTRTILKVKTHSNNKSVEELSDNNYQIASDCNNLNMRQTINQQYKIKSMNEQYSQNNSGFNQIELFKKNKKIGQSDIILGNRYRGLDSEHHESKSKLKQSFQDQGLSQNQSGYNKYNCKQKLRDNSSLKSVYSQKYQERTHKNQQRLENLENSMEMEVRKNLSKIENQNRKIIKNTNIASQNIELKYSKSNSLDHVDNSSIFGDSLAIYENPLMKNAQVVKRLSHLNSIFKDINNIKKQKMKISMIHKVKNIETQLIEIQRGILRLC